MALTVIIAAILNIILNILGRVRPLNPNNYRYFITIILNQLRKIPDNYSQYCK
jgi:hypothetical protein